MSADLKHVFRQLRRSPGFALTATLTLALGIGATSAIFTLVQQVLLRSLPVADPAGLWRIGDNEQCCHNSGLPDYTDKPNDWSLFSYLQYEDFRDHTRGLASLAAFEASDTEMSVRRAGSTQLPEPLYTEFVSGNSFEVLGLRPYAGRLLQPADDGNGAAPAAVISFQMWDQKLGRDPSIIGSSFLINGQPVTVVGIAPPGFYSERLSSTPPAFWLPLRMVATVTPLNATDLDRGDHNWLNLIGRLAPGAHVSSVQSEMQLELQQFLKSPVSQIEGRAAALIPQQFLRLTPGGGGVRRMQQKYQGDLHLLMWISTFVLLIVCANLANLMLARSVTHRQQIAVRAALGARRMRLVEFALLECVSLALVGGLFGVVVAWGGARLILHLAFQNDPIAISATPSLVVIAFAFGVSLLTGLLFGVAPAWMAAHADPIQALRGANRATGRHATLTQKGLVVAQAAVSVVLLCAAGYLILSIRKLEHQHFGFDPTMRTIIRFNPQNTGLQPDQLDGFYQRLDTALTNLPGIRRVAWSTWSPMDGNNYSEDVFLEGQPTPPAGSSVNLASWVRVSPEYFATVGTRVVQGRAFTDRDNRNAPNVAVVDEAFVHRYLHGESPIGAHFGDADPTSTAMFTIVGVVEDAQYWPPNDPQESVRPMYFVPAAQWPQVAPTIPSASKYTQFMINTHYMSSIEIETRGSDPALQAQLRNALGGIDSNLMITSFHSFADQVDSSFNQQRMIVQLTSLFGFVALALAAIGLYGVTSYAVAQRTTEIAIRMALGANRVRVHGMVLRGAFMEVGFGLLIGIPSAIAVGHLMSAELFGVSTWNPLVLASTMVLLTLVALLAAVVPASRAAGVEPMESLRGQ